MAKEWKSFRKARRRSKTLTGNLRPRRLHEETEPFYTVVSKVPTVEEQQPLVSTMTNAGKENGDTYTYERGATGITDVLGRCSATAKQLL